MFQLAGKYNCNCNFTMLLRSKDHHIRFEYISCYEVCVIP
uniref:Uncharacterized protein n=1 Tax=Anguilla anguilla TaxID=7936 RepID=A0A0E9RL68_ANGAN